MSSSLQPINAVINITYGAYNGNAYLFHTDGTYSRLNRITGEIDRTGNTAQSWSGWPQEWSDGRFDTCCTWDSEHVYFFRDAQFITYHMGQDRVIDGPRAIDSQWASWPGDWSDGIGAALYWGYHAEQKTTKAFFFRADSYLRCDVATFKVEEDYPATIADAWPGWPKHWDALDAAVDWGNGKLYFFRNDEYLRYDRYKDAVENDYPRPLDEFLEEHRARNRAQGEKLLFEDQLSGNREPFAAQVRTVCTELGIRPDWLMASMWTESGLKTDIMGPGGNYVGLHQMSKQLIFVTYGKEKHRDWATVRDVSNLTDEQRTAMINEFRALSNLEQFRYVTMWLQASLSMYRSKKIAIKSYDQLRLNGFGGGGMAATDATALASVIPRGNPSYDLNHDGAMNIAEFRDAVFRDMHQKRIPDTAAVRQRLG